MGGPTQSGSAIVRFRLRAYEPILGHFEWAKGVPTLAIQRFQWCLQWHSPRNYGEGKQLEWLGKLDGDPLSPNPIAIQAVIAIVAVLLCKFT